MVLWKAWGNGTLPWIGCCWEGGVILWLGISVTPVIQDEGVLGYFCLLSGFRHEKSMAFPDVDVLWNFLYSAGESKAWLCVLGQLFYFQQKMLPPLAQLLLNCFPIGSGQCFMRQKVGLVSSLINGVQKAPRNLINRKVWFIFPEKWKC